MTDGLIRTPELLRLIPVNRRTILRWHKAGKFPAPVRIGSCCAWVRAEVEAWIEARKGERPCT